jgi:shikimate dehydrogenase
MITTRCAVLGKPIDHSLSPVLHRAAYDALGLNWSYDAIEMDEDGLPEFLAGLDLSWRGLSLTMPLKRSVLQLLDSVSPVAGAAGAVNTVLFGDGLRIGENTDVPGAVAAIRERYDGRIRTAVVVGGCATAASMAMALGELGCWVATLLVREPDRAADTVQRITYNEGPLLAVGSLDGDPLDADIVVSTVPRPPSCWPGWPASRWSSTSCTTGGPPRWPARSVRTAPWSAGSTCWCTRPRSRWR